MLLKRQNAFSKKEKAFCLKPLNLDFLYKAKEIEYLI